MTWWPDLSQRRRINEAMDQPDLDRTSHVEALRGLEKLNRVSRGERHLWRQLRDLAKQAAPEAPLRVLDLASGGGDVTLALWRRADKAGIPLQISGCDFSPRAVEFARREAVNAGAKERGERSLRYFVMDVLQETLPTHYDVIMTSLFLHHLERPEAVNLLHRMAEAAGRVVLVSDLVRSRPGWIMIRLAMKLVTSSWVVHADAPRSLMSAFTVAEARELAAEAGLDAVSIRRAWPCRFLLRWEKPAEQP